MFLFCNLFAGGSSISVNVMEAPIRMVRKMDEIPENNDPSMTGRYTRGDFEKLQNDSYHQLSQYQLRESDEYNQKSWNNGVFLTESGHNDLKKIVAIAEKNHRDDSDSSIDYFSCNFYFDINLGKWDHVFVDGV